ncbi:MAG: YraN family protein [Methylacidiphilales bacterium]|nr:YraN family protein [Candidatus Methylacidiphilales bacterium]
MSNPSPSNYPDIGTLGEDLVAQWLESCGWKILHRRWRSRSRSVSGGLSDSKGVSRWGEIDIIAEYTQTLAFVEVKTRSVGSWDAGGRDAIMLRKQEKIYRTAQMYLAKFPEKADFNCRFDVAIAEARKVVSQNILKHSNINKKSDHLAFLSTPSHYLTLEEYIPGAFDSLIDDG